jgi:antitoxin ParD1/3/4
MRLSLTREVEAAIQAKVATGKYASANEVVREALELLDERERTRQARIQKLRQEAAQGLEDIEQGRVGPLNIEEIKAEGRRRLAAQRKLAA